MYSKLAIAHHIYDDSEDDLGGIKLPRPVKQNATTGRRTNLSLRYLPIIISSDILLVVLRLFQLNHLNDIVKNLVTIHMSIFDQSCTCRV